MQKKKQLYQKRSAIILAAIIVSVVLYLAGVYSGLQANKVIEKKTGEDIESLKKETEIDILGIKTGTENQVGTLRDYIGFLEKNLKSVQLEEGFINTLSEKEKCNFSAITMEYLFSELNYYWEILPYRIEEYERNNVLSKEYISLKKQYTQLSIRTWILAKDRQQKCDSTIIHGLHFYSTDCSTCVEQGEELDIFSERLKTQGYDLVLFPIDINSDEPIVGFIREYYGIETTPSVLINGKLYEGRVFRANELVEGLE